MLRRIKYLVVGLFLRLSTTALSEQGTTKKSKSKKIAPLLKGLSNYQFPVSTKSKLAQRYFNQGMMLSYGFNHAEAARSFRAAQKEEPKCAMAYWGEALVLGPNINLAMQDDNVPKAWKALQKALKLAPKATQREQDYIVALSKRYAVKPVKDRSKFDMAYVNAMRKLAAKYQNDYDAQVLFAEAMMDTTPWNYWDKQLKPKPITKEILRTLERVLARRPNHAGACHLYIHAVEAAHPEWAEAAADRLRTLVPGAGHLVHMPSHIYLRIGRYADASIANVKAIAADNDYVTQCHAQGVYPLAYMPHNHHFLWFSASMEGRAKQSIAAAKHIAKHTDPMMMRKPGFGTLQHFYSMEMYGLARFGKWKEIKAYRKPKNDLKYPTGVWHYVRGLAHCREGNLKTAKKHLSHLKKLANDKQLDTVKIWDNHTTRQILEIAEQALAGEIAAKQQNWKDAIRHHQKAVELEDAMRYEEPQLWYAPTRQFLGAVLLDAKQFAKAEVVFRADLKKYPKNGWSLFGLHEALKAQGKMAEAQTVWRAFEKARRRADVKLKSSKF